MNDENDNNVGVIVGRLRFSLQLDGKSSNSGKRKRADGETNPEDGVNAAEPLLAGWILEETSFPSQVVDRNSNSMGNTYLVSVPRDLLRATCDACRFEQQVHVKHYSILPLARDDDSTSQPSSAASCRLRGLLELHSGGLRVEDDSYPDRPVVAESEFWTWRQLLRKEAVDAIHPESSALQESSASNSRSFQQKDYSFRGQVSSISPIITMDPADPFALLELYDASTTGSCVVVLQKAALQTQLAIRPGDTLVLIQARRQAWRIPQVLGKQHDESATDWHLTNRIPTHVFVLQHVWQLDWYENTDTISSSEFPLLPEPLTCLCGRIQQVHLMQMGKQSKGVHYLDFYEANETICAKRLFLTYFPMSTSLQLSLRPGAVIQATNVHGLGQGNYCACLRSTVHAVKLALEHNPSSTASLALDYRFTTPFAYHRRIRKSYLEFAIRRQVITFVQNLSLLPNLASNEEWGESLLHLVVGDTGTSRSRSAYAEFFDHGVCNKRDPSGLGCHVSRLESSLEALVPVLADLGQIHQIMMESCKQRLEQVLIQKDNKMSVGWTGSFSLSKTALLKKECGDNCQADSLLLTGGSIVGFDASFDAITCVSIGNGKIVLPGILCSPIAMDMFHQNQVVWAQIQAMTLSCLCIGTLPSKGKTETSWKVSHLSKFSDRANEPLRGSTVILETGGRLFVVSVYLELEKVVSVLKNVCPMESSSGPAKWYSSLPSIGDCLLPNTVEFTRPVAALMVRKFFNAYKARKGVYNGYTITLAHVPTGDLTMLSSNEASCLQTMDLKATISVQPAQLVLLRRIFENMWHYCPTEEQLSMALVWWKMASSERHCTLLSGGWDELCPTPALSARTRAILVRLPQSALQRDDKRGYLRMRCGLDDLSACVVSFLPPCETQDATTFTESSFDFMRGSKVFPGNLDRRPRRRRFGEIAHGELLESVNSAAGVPSCSLLDLNHAACRDLRENCRRHMAPSLVRQIRGATFLGISYCRALAECSKCFAALCKPKGYKDSSKTQGGIVASVPALLDDQPSFWDQPLPMNALETPRVACFVTGTLPESSSNTQQQVMLQQDRRTTTSLVCPNKCNVDGAIKWECSGTLDDGTGQAKLYAERQAALLLLGMTGPCIEAIEQGAWLVPDGIVFRKNMPPDSSIRHSVQTAKNLAANHFRGLGRKLREEDVLRFLSPTTRAEYLMQRHCRLSKEPTRDLSYFVRCKPLSDQVRYLNHTEIKLAPSRDIATYSLPPIKLNLVDCQVALSSSSSVRGLL